MEKTKELPSEIYIFIDAIGNLRACEDLKDVPAYFEQGIFVGLYHLQNVGKVTKEIKYDSLWEQGS